MHRQTGLLIVSASLALVGTLIIAIVLHSSHPTAPSSKIEKAGSIHTAPLEAPATLTNYQPASTTTDLQGPTNSSSATPANRRYSCACGGKLCPLATGVINLACIAD